MYPANSNISNIILWALIIASFITLNNISLGGCDLVCYKCFDKECLHPNISTKHCTAKVSATPSKKEALVLPYCLSLELKDGRVYRDCTSTNDTNKYCKDPIKVKELKGVKKEDVKSCKLCESDLCLGDQQRTEAPAGDSKKSTGSQYKSSVIFISTSIILSLLYCYIIM